jgi:hypothetical protein
MKGLASVYCLPFLLCLAARWAFASGYKFYDSPSEANIGAQREFDLPQLAIEHGEVVQWDLEEYFTEPNMAYSVINNRSE